jgi:hypothetical protein
MKITTAALLAAFALNGCSSKSGEAPASVDHATRAPGARAMAPSAELAPPAAAAAAAPAVGGAAGPAPGGSVAARHVDSRKVIRTGRVELVVDAVDASRAKLEALVQGAGGYIDSTQVEAHGTIAAAVLVIRVPADAFTTLLPALHQLEKRLLELATAKNGSLEQILTVERELARVRGEVEGFEGHLKQWSDQVSLSTLTLSLTQRVVAVAAVVTPPPPTQTLASKTSESFHNSTEALRAFASWLLINGVALLPWLLVLVPAGLGLRRLARRHRLPVAVATSLPRSPAP